MRATRTATASRSAAGPVIVATLPLIWPQQALAEVSEISTLRWFVAATMLLLTVITLLLARSRARLLRSEKALTESRAELERRVQERTLRLQESGEHLQQINHRLSEAIQSHECTEILLRETQDYLHDMLDSMPSMLIGVSPEGHVTHWNSSTQRFTGIAAEAIVGRPLLEHLPQLINLSPRIDAAIESGTPQNEEGVRRGHGSHALYFDITIYPLLGGRRGAVIRIDDVTRRVQLENLAIQNEKLISLGELAAGMAHEINNPLATVLQTVQTLQRRLTSRLPKNRQMAETAGIDLEALSRYLRLRKVPRMLESVREAGERAADIVRNMLEFSRYGARQRTWVDLADLTEHALTLAKPGFRLEHGDTERIQLVRNFPAEPLPKVPCSAAEIQQVLLNLLRNACQALQKKGSSTGEAPVITVALDRNESHAMISVSDNGPGMSDEVLRHIFDPFYTTKTVGQGTGLGLSVSYFIIHEHHHGSLSVTSEPGRGSCFEVRLPLETPQDPPGL